MEGKRRRKIIKVRKIKERIVRSQGRGVYDWQFPSAVLQGEATVTFIGSSTTITWSLCLYYTSCGPSSKGIVASWFPFRQLTNDSLFMSFTLRQPHIN